MVMSLARRSTKFRGGGVAAPSNLFAETFAGAAGAAWPTGWTTFTGGTGSLATQRGSGVGGLTSSTSPYTASALAYRNDVLTANYNVVFDVAFSSVVEQYNFIYLRASSPSSISSVVTGYYLQFFPGNGAVSGSVNYNTGGGDTALSGDLTFGAFTANTYKRFRFQVLGTTIQVKTWDPAGAEPGSWLYSGTNSAITAPGRFAAGVSVGSGGQNTAMLLKNITATQS